MIHHVAAALDQIAVGLAIGAVLSRKIGPCPVHHMWVLIAFAAFLVGFDLANT